MDYNQPITFGRSGLINDLSPSGFDTSEDANHSWTVKQFCEFEVALPMPRQEVSLRIEATPFLAQGKVNSQQLFVYVNGLFQGFHTFYVDEHVVFQILRNAISSRATRVQLVLPTAASPQALGISADIRPLGIALTRLTFLMN
jgi:hypothetical protein